MRSIRTAAALALLVAVMSVGGEISTSAQGGSSELRCTQEGSPGYFVTSNRRLTCVYYRPDGAVEFYTGAFHRLGIDIGPTNALQLGFRVRPQGPIRTGGLEGKFVGAGLQVEQGSGFGADALIGGANGQTLLLPSENVSITGVGGNGGLSVINLQYRGMERSRDE